MIFRAVYIRPNGNRNNGNGYMKSRLARYLMFYDYSTIIKPL